MGGVPTRSFYSLRPGAEKKGDAVRRVRGFAAVERLGLDFSGADVFDGVDKFGEDSRVGDGNIVRAEHEFHLWRESGELFDGCNVSVEICFRAK